MNNLEQEDGFIEDAPVLDAMARLWASRLLIGCCMVVFAVVAGVVSLFMSPVYEASVVLMIKTDDSQTSNLSGSLSSLKSLTKGKLGGSDDQRSAYIASLSAREFATGFIVQHNLIPVLEADSGSGLLKSSPLTPWMATTTFLKNVLSVHEDQSTGLVTVTVRWRDPAIAAAWCNDYVAYVDGKLRRTVADNSRRTLQYLATQSNDVTYSNLKSAINELTEREMRRAMMASVTTHFAFDNVDDAIPPERKAGPHRAVMVVLCGLFGFVFGVTIVMASGPLQKLRARARDFPPVSPSILIKLQRLVSGHRLSD